MGHPLRNGCPTAVFHLGSFKKSSQEINYIRMGGRGKGREGPKYPHLDEAKVENPCCRGILSKRNRLSKGMEEGQSK